MEEKEPKRQPRKDFLSLMEHSHIFLYMGAMGQKEAAGIELWPLSKRSRYTAHLSTKEQVELVNWIEGTDPTPIIPVERTFGWRPGGSQFTYIGFNGFQDKKFAIAFDEPRLFEAITTFLDATGNYENSSNVPMFSVEDVRVDDANGYNLLMIKLRQGATLGFHLPGDVLAKLKTIIAKK